MDFESVDLRSNTSFSGSRSREDFGNDQHDPVTTFGMWDEYIIKAFKRYVLNLKVDSLQEINRHIHLVKRFEFLFKDDILLKHVMSYLESYHACTQKTVTDNFFNTYDSGIPRKTAKDRIYGYLNGLFLIKLLEIRPFEYMKGRFVKIYISPFGLDEDYEQLLLLYNYHGKTSLKNNDSSSDEIVEQLFERGLDLKNKWKDYYKNEEKQNNPGKKSIFCEIHNIGNCNRCFDIKKIQK